MLKYIIVIMGDAGAKISPQALSFVTHAERKDFAWRKFPVWQHSPSKRFAPRRFKNS